MKCSRREVCFWIPALMASRGLAAEGPIPSKIFRFEDLPVQSGEGSAVRHILQGKTHTGYGIEMHETDLAPGAMPHPAHHHAHEEVFLIREGHGGGYHRRPRLPPGPRLRGLCGLE